MSGRGPVVAVIGAGYFGCSTAVALADAGCSVLLLERLPHIIGATSKHNTNRVHQGFHYPRDLKTAVECRMRFKQFESVFSAAIRRVPNLYCVAEEDSRTSPDEYLRFCELAGLSYAPIDLPNQTQQVRSCGLGVMTTETMCDPDIFRDIVTARMQESSSVLVSCNTRVASIARRGSGFELAIEGSDRRLSCDAVVNCCYADINRLTAQLGHDVVPYQFEYTVVPIVEADFPQWAVTVMDGPFMTLFPGRQSRRFLMYHVRHSVIATDVAPTVDPAWLHPTSAPFAALDKQALFAAMRWSCSTFIPALSTATLVGFLHAPRMILANHDNDDSRPSMIQDYGDGYLTVFAGKIDRCLDIADSARAAVGRYLGESFSSAAPVVAREL